MATGFESMVVYGKCGDDVGRRRFGLPGARRRPRYFAGRFVEDRHRPMFDVR